MNDKIVLVTGITGHQGGSVVNALLQLGNLKIRGISRNANSQACLDLKSRGVEIIEANLFDTKGMQIAFKGCYAAFVATDYWDKDVGNKELDLGKKLADLAKEAGVQYYIWSSLVNAEKISDGKYDVPHFTLKAQVQEYIEKIGLKGIFISPAFYFQNFRMFNLAEKRDNKVIFNLPLKEDTFLTAVDIDDIGPAVAEILKRPDEFVGKFLPLIGTHQSVKEFISQFIKITGEHAELAQIDLKEFSKQSPEMAQMFGFFEQYTYYGPEVDLNLGRKFLPKTKEWKEWLQKNGIEGVIKPTTGA